jgi:hypothetical protein
VLCPPGYRQIKQRAIKGQKTFAYVSPSIARVSTQTPNTKRFLRRFIAKALQKDCEWSSGEPELVEDAFHCSSNGTVVGVDWLGLCAPRVGPSC